MCMLKKSKFIKQLYLRAIYVIAYICDHEKDAGLHNSNVSGNAEWKVS